MSSLIELAGLMPDVIPTMSSGVPKTRMLGMYVGMGVDPRTDWDSVLTRLAARGYNAISIFLTTVFANQQYPWPLTAGLFDFTVDNEDYYANLNRALVASAKTGVRLHFCFVDQFHSHHDNKGNPGDNPGPDPFRQGLDLGNEWDENLLYDSITFAPLKYYWVKWDEPRPRQYTNYRFLGAFGMGMKRFVNRIVNLTKKVSVNWPELPLPTWKWSNENLAMVDSTGHPTDKRGGRDEVHRYIDGRFNAKGMGGRGFFDFLILDGKTPMYQLMVDVFRKGVRLWNKAGMEIHEIMDVADTLKFPLTLPERKEVIFSTDGDLKMEAEYYKLGHSTVPNVDLKFDVKKGEPIPPDVMDFFNLYWPRYIKYVKD
jgi:hypothetical protein